MFNSRLLSISGIGAFSASFLIACSAAPTRQFDAAAESAKLMQRDAHWADLATAGTNVDSVVAYWSDDAVVMEPGQPVAESKAAIRKYVEESYKTPGFKIHWVSEKPVFSADGTMAYMRARDEMDVPGPNGAPMTLHLRGYSIWRLDPDGQWRCVVDISNEAPPPAQAKS